MRQKKGKGGGDEGGDREKWERWKGRDGKRIITRIDGMITCEMH